MDIFKSFSIKETQKEIESYIKDFDEFENYKNQIIINYNFTLRRIRNRISCQNFIQRYFLNKKLNNYYLGKMNIMVFRFLFKDYLQISLNPF